MNRLAWSDVKIPLDVNLGTWGEIMDRPSFGIIVGRFQTHELHDGHTELFRVVKGRHNRIIIFVGCTKVGLTRHNPLDFETRKKMIQAKFPDFTVLPLQDKKTDEQWSKALDERIDDAIGGVPAEVILYGSRDSFAPHYNGRHKVKELEIEIPQSTNSTDIRAKLTNTVMESADFRAGCIYAMHQLFPRVITCVDVAIVHMRPWTHGLMSDEVKAAEKPGCNLQPTLFLLLGKKEEDTLWRFVGGHAMKKNPKFEGDVVMEAQEETTLDVTDVEYVDSNVINDWRWRSEPTEGIKSLFFIAKSMTMGGHGADDLPTAQWHKLSDLTPEDIEPVHRHFFVSLVKHIQTKWLIDLGPNPNKQDAKLPYQAIGTSL